MGSYGCLLAHPLVLSSLLRKRTQAQGKAFLRQPGRRPRVHSYNSHNPCPAHLFASIAQLTVGTWSIFHGGFFLGTFCSSTFSSQFSNCTHCVSTSLSSSQKQPTGTGVSLTMETETENPGQRSAEVYKSWSGIWCHCGRLRLESLLVRCLQKSVLKQRAFACECASPRD